jgi:hypothetical protein
MLFYMKHQHLHELAKFASGLIAGDFFAGLWLATHNGFPVWFMGIYFTSGMIVPWLIFDVALFIMLVHYGWHFGKTPMLRERTLLLATGALFGIVAFVHLVRIFTNTDFVILNWDAPILLSWLGTVVTAYLSYMSFHLALRVQKSKK